MDEHTALLRRSNAEFSVRRLHDFQMLNCIYLNFLELLLLSSVDERTPERAG